MKSSLAKITRVRTYAVSNLDFVEKLGAASTLQLEESCGPQKQKMYS